VVEFEVVKSTLNPEAALPLGVDVDNAGELLGPGVLDAEFGEEVQETVRRAAQQVTAHLAFILNSGNCINR
jgi:hypothetical protein